MAVLTSRIALTVRAPGDHNNINFEVTTSMTERDLFAGAEDSCAETLRIWKNKDTNFMVVSIEYAIVIMYVTVIMKTKADLKED